jgi:succinate dehydrogenase / fumarate reductase, cytochrome b subunit
MGVTGNFLHAAVGRKAVMAVSGILLFGFVLAHMAGNLKLYQGPEALNAYAVHLRTLGEPVFPPMAVLWMLRVGLLAAAAAHVAAAWSVTRQSLRARGTRYEVTRRVETTFAARTMRWTGVIVLLYVLFHLADLTWGSANPDYVPGDVYHNVVASFSRWPVALLYVAANLALGLHLFHGLWSLFQTLGLNNPRFNALRRVFAGVFAALITLGNVSFPVAVLAGVVK